MNHPPADFPHLTREQKQAWAGALRGKGWSYPRIAGALGVSDPTVLAWLGDSRSTSRNLEVEQTTGQDGKQRPAEMPSDDEIQERRRKVWESLQPTPQALRPLHFGHPRPRLLRPWNPKDAKQGRTAHVSGFSMLPWNPKGRRRWARWQG